MKITECVSKEKLGAVVDALIGNSFDSIMVTEAGEGSSNAPIVFVNEAFTALTGYASEEVLGKSPNFLQGADTDTAVIDQLREDLAAGRVFEGETTNYRKDGSPFTMHWRVAPIAEEGGEPKYFIAVQRVKD